MVVDPTSKTVTLHYGATGADHLGLLLSIVGIVLLVVMVRRRSFAAAWSPLSNLARRRRLSVVVIRRTRRSRAGVGEKGAI
jgi:hypothetical protein